MDKAEKAMYDIVDFIQSHEAVQFQLSTKETATLKSLIFRLVSLWHDSVNHSKKVPFQYDRMR